MKYVPHKISFKIAGTGPEEERLRLYAGNDKRIEFLGFVDENQIKEYYANALVILFVPYDEDYGFITVEAMKSKKPVITTSDSGGPLEFVNNDRSGFIVPPNPEHIAEKINFFIENKDRAFDMGNYAYETVNTITWKKFIHELDLNKPEGSKKKILVLSTYSCFPPRGGGQQRLFNIYSRLALNYDVTICSIVESHKPSDDLILENGLQQICIPQSSEHARLQWNEEKKLGKNLYDCGMIDFVEKSPQYVNKIKSMMLNADIVVLFHPYLYTLSKYMDASSTLFYEAVDIESNQKKTYLKNEAWERKIFEIEKQSCNHSKIIFVTSSEDKTKLTQLYKIDPEKVLPVPNGVNTDKIGFILDIEKGKQKKLCNLKNTNTILFVASWHPPNLEALKFIISDLLPKLKNTKLLLVGSIKDYYHSKIGKLPNNVLAFGVVDELEKYEIYKLADIAINPMFSGSGTNIKMLDYFSAGIPVVTTRIGARGLNIEHNKEAIICSAETMVHSIQQLMADKEVQNRLKKNARLLVESAYSWRGIVTDIEHHLENLK
jgi:glycosyltransferase involved in cell wall biosynthesis